jgi:hypothetical protein
MCQLVFRLVRALSIQCFSPQPTPDALGLRGAAHCLDHPELGLDVPRPLVDCGLSVLPRLFVRFLFFRIRQRKVCALACWLALHCLLIKAVHPSLPSSALALTGKPFGALGSISCEGMLDIQPSLCFIALVTLTLSH